MRAGALLALLLLAGTHAFAADLWRIQSPPSHVDFGVRLLWVHTVHGRFEHISGVVAPQPDGRVVVDARVAVDSLAMDSARLRRWVLGEEFFDLPHHADLRFVSAPTALRTLDEGGTLAGELTLRGVTRPVELDLSPAHCTADACTILAQGQLLRSDFGMRGHHTVLSDHVELALSIAIARTPG
jgi:polyisoprenoid-binding protein YceI